MMGGNTGVRRDVLRWLVALNLSSPIKNIKRDFSNGFLVAEIFSRYFPHDIQMHSFDYGTKKEKKKDNWAQLQKFFKKRSFMVMKDEIETIISCQTTDGAGPLLERMFKFLTLKRCKPEEVEIEKEKQQQQHIRKANSESVTDSSVLVFAAADSSQTSEVKDAEGNRNEFANLTSISTSAIDAAERTSTMCTCINQGNHRRSPCSNPRCQQLVSASDSFYSTVGETAQQNRWYENGSGVLLPLQSNMSSYNDGGYNQMKFKSDNSSLQRIHRRDENQQKDHTKVCLSAVERARQREVFNKHCRQQKPSKGVINEPINTSRKTPSDAALAFRSPHRQRTFKQYTLTDYRRQQTAACAQLGKLGPDLEDQELGEKREKLERMKEFGRIVRSCNTTQGSVLKKIRTPSLSKRQKALEFAATVPKPKVKKVEVDSPPTPEKNRHHLSELQVLEAKHEADRHHVEVSESLVLVSSNSTSSSVWSLRSPSKSMLGRNTCSSNVTKWRSYHSSSLVICTSEAADKVVISSTLVSMVGRMIWWCFRHSQVVGIGRPVDFGFLEGCTYGA